MTYCNGVNVIWCICIITGTKVTIPDTCR